MSWKYLKVSLIIDCFCIQDHIAVVNIPAYEIIIRTSYWTLAIWKTTKH